MNAWAWPNIRPVIVAEMQRLKMNPLQMSKAVGLSRSTVYTLLDRSNTIHSHSLSAMLTGIGRSFAWLEKKLAATKLPAGSK